MSADPNEQWLTIEEAYPQLREYFRTRSALRHHLWKRQENGLTAADAVRMSPLGRLLLNPERVRGWVIGEGAPRAAA